MNTLRTAVVTLTIEYDNEPPVERVYTVTVKDEAAAIKAAYRLLPRKEHELSTLQGVRFYQEP